MRGEGTPEMAVGCRMCRGRREGMEPLRRSVGVYACGSALKRLTQSFFTP